MTRFVRFTTPDGLPVYINVDRITHVFPGSATSDRSTIALTGGQVLYVTSSGDEVMQVIEGTL